MGVRGITYVVFLLPVIISTLLGSFVMTEFLNETDRELVLFSFKLPWDPVISSEKLEIISLKSTYSTTEPVEIQISIDDSIFNCGDLYITIRNLSSSSQNVVTQSGYFEQCFSDENILLPIDDIFSEIIDSSGTYEIEIEMNDKNYEKIITKSAKFIVN